MYREALRREPWEWMWRLPDVRCSTRPASARLLTVRIKLPVRLSITLYTGPYVLCWFMVVARPEPDERERRTVNAQR